MCVVASVCARYLLMRERRTTKFNTYKCICMALECFAYAFGSFWCFSMICLKPVEMLLCQAMAPALC